MARWAATDVQGEAATAAKLREEKEAQRAAQKAGRGLTQAEGELIMRLDRWFADVMQARDKMTPWWEALARNLLPRRFDYGDGNRDGNTLRAKTAVKDRTATQALRVLVSGLYSLTSPPWQKWWEQAAPQRRLNEVKAVREWLEEATDLGHDVLSRSGYYDEILKVYEDEAGFGTGALIIHETHDENMARCEHLPLGSYSITRDAAGKVNGFTRNVSLTIQQIADQFGDERLPSGMKRMLDRGEANSERRTVRHCIKAREDNEREQYGPRSFDWVEYYWLGPEGQAGTSSSSHLSPKPTNQSEMGGAAAQRRILQENGYHDFPVVVFCWGRNSSDAFGTDCPGMDALEDLLMLQDMRRDTLNAIKKQVTPPVQVPDGMMQTPVSFLPAGKTVLPAGAAAGQGIRNLHDPVNIDLSDLLQDVEVVRQMIRDAFYNRVVAPVLFDERNARATAAEIYETKRQQLPLMGPIQERNTRNGHDLAVQRIMQIIYRRAQMDWELGQEGILPPPPEELWGVQPMTHYVSEVAIALRQSHLGAFDAHKASLFQTAQARPEVLDRYDWDAWDGEEARLRGIPERLTLEDEAVMAIRQRRAEQQELQAAAAAAPGVARAARDLADAEPTDDSVLSRFTAAGE